MYSSNGIDRVTCLRRSSRCIAAQSGSGLPTMTPLGAGTDSLAGEQPGLQLRVGDIIGQRSVLPSRLETADRQPQGNDPNLEYEAPRHT
jgi:hypothetical protein